MSNGYLQFNSVTLVTCVIDFQPQLWKNDTQIFRQNFENLSPTLETWLNLVTSVLVLTQNIGWEKAAQIDEQEHLFGLSGFIKIWDLIIADHVGCMGKSSG